LRIVYVRAAAAPHAAAITPCFSDIFHAFYAALPARYLLPHMLMLIGACRRCHFSHAVICRCHMLTLRCCFDACCCYYAATRDFDAAFASPPLMPLDARRFATLPLLRCCCC